MTEEQFGRRLLRICPGITAGRRRFDHGQRKYVYQFPPIEESRRLFAEMIRTDIDWDEGDLDDGDQGQSGVGGSDLSPDDL